MEGVDKNGEKSPRAKRAKKTMSENSDETEKPDSQPIFNIPGTVSALIAAFLAIQAAQSFVFSERAQLLFNMWFGFIPLRLTHPEAIAGGLWPLTWTPVTHAFLHAGWEHVLINSAWMLVFGTPVARRYGSRATLIAFTAAAVVGAAMFALFSSPQISILVGASGGISGLTGIAMRFVFQPVVVGPDPETGKPAVLGRLLASWPDIARSVPARTFIVFWLALNALVPLVPALTGGLAASVAWQAHLGGFVFGLLVAPLLERRT